MLGGRCGSLVARMNGRPFVRHTNTYRFNRLMTNANPSNEKAKLLNQSLQQGLKPKKVATASSSTAAAPTKPSSGHRFQQAMINGICSFLVVLLAAQSLKSGTERRNAVQHLEAATDVLAGKKEKLRRVQESADELAEVCLQVVQKQNQGQASSWWGSNNSSDSKEDEALQRELATAIRKKLRDIIEDAALTQTEKEQVEVQELVAQIESPIKSRGFTI